jgi:biotin transport system substrate-specific component
MGLPVFSGFGAGLAKLVGPTGGYLIGYLPLAMLTGLFADRRGFGFWKYPVGMIAGTVVLYALGTAWFMVSLGRGFAESLAICVTPFLIGDAAKIVAASLLSPVLRTRALRRNV